MSSKYRQHGEKCNNICSDCGIAIWEPQGIRTIYHGQENWATYDTGEPESVVILDGVETRLVCYNCKDKYTEVKR